MICRPDHISGAFSCFFNKLRLGSPELPGVEMNGAFRTGESEAIAVAAVTILPVRVDDSGEDIVLMPLQ